MNIPFIFFVVSSLQFMPFKKRYYRYLMHEEVTVAEVSASLIESGVMKPAMSQHGIRNLVM